MKKKIMSLMLALVLALSMCTVAFASESSHAYKEDEILTINKICTVNNGTIPAMTFTYKFEGVEYKNNEGKVVDNPTIPEISDVKIYTSEHKKGVYTSGIGVKIDASKYELGYYTYKITEEYDSYAGVTTTEVEKKMILTITRDENGNKHYTIKMENASGEKTDAIYKNTAYDAGSLTVVKQIAGNMADMTKKFSFTIKFDGVAEGQKFAKAIKSNSENGKWSDDGLTYTINMGDKETVTLSNIPADLTYSVTEEKEEYESTVVGGKSDGVISANDTASVTFKNTLQKNVDTGINLDSMPYILMMGVACAGMVVFFARKRVER